MALMISNACAFRRSITFASALFAVLLGLAVRAKSLFLAPFFVSYLPDVLWAFLIFSIALIVSPRQPTKTIALAALGICFLVECSQLYQGDWINAVRATRVGGLLLGFSFLWSDLFCYVIGIACGAAFDRALRFLLPTKGVLP